MTPWGPTLYALTWNSVSLFYKHPYLQGCVYVKSMKDSVENGLTGFLSFLSKTSTM